MEIEDIVENQYSDDNSKTGNKEKRSKRGIIYLSSIPQFMNVTRLREIMLNFGEVGRIFLQPAVHKGKKNKPAKHFTEGWVEFKKKRVAKQVAMHLNNKQIGGRKKSKYYDCIWNMKYLSRFKWVHLCERLAYEKAVHKQRMRAEIAQAKKEATHFSLRVDQSKMKRFSETQSGSALTYPQRKTESEIIQEKTINNITQNNRSDFLKSIFA